MVETKNKFGSRWVQKDVILLGGMWGIVVGIIEDINTGDLKIRIAKGKIKGKVKRVLGKLQAEYENKDDPVAQVNRLNLKSRAEWEQVKQLCDKYFTVLEQGGAMKK